MADKDGLRGDGQMAPLKERQRLRAERDADERARAQGFSAAQHLKDVAEAERSGARGPAAQLARGIVPGTYTPPEGDSDVNKADDDAEAKAAAKAAADAEAKAAADALIPEPGQAAGPEGWGSNPAAGAGSGAPAPKGKANK